MAASAFDTRLRWPRWLFGSAPSDIATRLRQAGTRVIQPVVICHDRRWHADGRDPAATGPDTGEANGPGHPQRSAHAAFEMSRRTALEISAAMIAAMATAGVWTYLELPAGALVPSHWNAAGHVDGYSGAWILFLMPALTVGFDLLMAALLLVEPRRRNLLASTAAYNAILLGFAGLMAVIQGITVWSALRGVQAADAIGSLVFVAAGLFLVVIGIFLPRIRSNFFMGIRTPWTLSSERSWERTHRLGAWLFAGLGVLIVLSAALPRAAVFVIPGGAAVVIVLLAAYSYLVWRDDPDKHLLGR